MSSYHAVSNTRISLQTKTEQQSKQKAYGTAKYQPSSIFSTSSGLASSGLTTPLSSAKFQQRTKHKDSRTK